MREIELRRASRSKGSLWQYLHNYIRRSSYCFLDLFRAVLDQRLLTSFGTQLETIP